MSTPIIMALVAAVLAILTGLWLAKWILGLGQGSEKMIEIAKAIQEGAKAYLNRQTRTVAMIAVIVFVILGLVVDWTTALGFVVGAVLSALAGYIGMYIAVRANVRTAEAAKS
ncbi:MAG: sodium/proton-translocating pyrophosphatase, partial [Patescibacteria group bacterium]